MRCLLFTSTGLRHFALAERLAAIAEVTVIAEARRTAPVGGPALREHWRRVAAAEAEVFGIARPPANVYVVPFNSVSTMHALDRPGVAFPLDSYEHVVVYGASWIKPPLLPRLVAHGAINLHVGIAPEYRGSGCNAWAEYDGAPELVGTTLQRLAAELDAGDVLQTTTTKRAPDADPYVNGMQAVADGQAALCALLQTARWPEAQPQDLTRMRRYTRSADWDEAVAQAWLRRLGCH